MSTSTTQTRVIASLVASVAALSLLAGCTGGNDATERIMDKLDTMQQEIDSLKESVAAGGTATGQGTGSSSDSTGSSNSTQAPADKSGFETKLADLEQRAAAAVDTAKKATVPANAADRPKAYIEAKAPLETLENEVDALEDQLETAMSAGAIDRQTYFALDQRADAIDDSLDQAKDALELIMGVDD